MEKKLFAGHLTALFTVLVWGTTFVATKLLLESFTPIEILFFRFLIGYLSLWAVSPRFLKTTGLRQELLFAAAGMCGVTLYFLMENIALTYSPASNVGVILAVSPLFTALLAHFFLDGERLSFRFFLGFGAAIAGIVLIAVNGSAVLKTNPRGDLLAVGAAAVWAVYSILMKKIGQLGYSTIQSTRRVFFYGILLMIPALSLFDFRLGIERLRSPVDLFNILYLGFGASALCFVTWNWSVKVLGAIRTSAYIYAVPVINIAAAVLVLHERITPLAVLGTVLTLAGLLLSEGGHGKPQASGTPQQPQGHA